MMSLPTFSDPNPSSAYLQQEQQRLHDQADKMLEQTGLLNTLSAHGVLDPIGGSYAYGLMVWPDIDLGLVNDNITTDNFATMVAELIKNPYVRKVSTANTVDFKAVRANLKGYWLGLELPFENERWSIDCWLQKRDWVPKERDPYFDLLNHLSDEQKDAVLHIKYQLIFRKLYGKDYYSVDIYNAVAKDGILTIDEFLLSRVR